MTIVEIDTTTIYTALRSVHVYFGQLSKRKEVAGYINKLKKENRTAVKKLLIYINLNITSGKFRQ